MSFSSISAAKTDRLVQFGSAPSTPKAVQPLTLRAKMARAIRTNAPFVASQVTSDGELPCDSNSDTPFHVQELVLTFTEFPLQIRVNVRLNAITRPNSNIEVSFMSNEVSMTYDGTALPSHRSRDTKRILIDLINSRNSHIEQLAELLT